MGDSKQAVAGVGGKKAAPAHGKQTLYTPIPWLDKTLTAIFIIEVVWIFYIYNEEPHTMVAFAGLLAVSHFGVKGCKWFFERLGNFLSTRAHAAGFVDQSKPHPLSGRIQMKKWKEQSWQLVIHVVMTAWEIYIMWDKTWWTEPWMAWAPHPAIQYKTIDPVLKYHYITQLAVWSYTCYVHVFQAERVKDYFVMFIHHVVTIGLVSLSACDHYYRVGLIVLVVHDASDILIDVLKMTNYLKLEGPRGFFASEIAFISCVATFVYLRLYEFPTRVLPSAGYMGFAFAYHPDPHNLVYEKPVWTYEGFMDRWIPPPPNNYALLPCNLLLWVLQCLHIYWTCLFFRLGYRIVTGGAREASRQEYEGDSDDEEEEVEQITDKKNDDASKTLSRTRSTNKQPATVGGGDGEVDREESNDAPPSSGSKGRRARRRRT